MIAIEGFPVLNNRMLQHSIRGVAVVLILIPAFTYNQYQNFPGYRALLPCTPFDPSVRRSSILSAPRGVIDLIARDPIRSPFFAVISQSSRIAHSCCSPNGDDPMVRGRAP